MCTLVEFNLPGSNDCGMTRLFLFTGLLVLFTLMSAVDSVLIEETPKKLKKFDPIAMQNSQAAASTRLEGQSGNGCKPYMKSDRKCSK